MFNHNHFIFLNKFLIICAVIPSSYQQNVRTTIKNKELTFCIQNHTMSNTLQTFWQDANNNCELESKRLLELYSQFLTHTNLEEDQCSSLLKHQIRKKLIQTLTTQLEDSFVMKTLQTNGELKQILRNLQEIDQRVSYAVWERSLEEVYMVVDARELINDIVSFKEEAILVTALQSLFNKYFLREQHQLNSLIPLLTYHVAALYKKRLSSTLSAKGLERFYLNIPKDLRVLYESSKQIGLLNYHHWEYLYAPRDNGPDSDRRLPLTWSETKNTTDSDGHLEVTFNDKGLVAFGSRYGSSLKYLYADVEHQAAYFWISSGLKSSQWWQVIWPYDTFLRKAPNFLIFQNDDTQELLCATTPYDENRRYVTLLTPGENMNNPACFWSIIQF